MTQTAQPPLVSVVMIFFNAAAFMPEAVDSVLAQSHFPVELLLCDDGSSDASTALARQLAQHHPDRVRYLHHPHHAHRGTGATRTLGVAAAGGELIAFLDADDVWLPDHLQREIECLSGAPQADAVCGWALDWHSWRTTDAADAWSPLPWPGGTLVAPPAMMTAVLRQGSFATPICSLLVRRQAVLEVRGFEDSFSSMYEDQVLLAKLYLTRPIVLCDARTALYRQHPWSSTAKAIRRGSYHPSAANRSRQRFLRWLSQQPQLLGDHVDPQLHAALAEALQPYERPSARLRWQLAAAKRAARARRPGRGTSGSTPSPPASP